MPLDRRRRGLTFRFVNPRCQKLIDCAELLEAGEGGDRDADTLEEGARRALELCAEVLGRHDVPQARGFKDACDKLAANGIVSWDLCDRLKRVFDVAERARHAWSTLAPGDLQAARAGGARALRELAYALDRELETTPAPAPPT